MDMSNLEKNQIKQSFIDLIACENIPLLLLLKDNFHKFCRIIISLQPNQYYQLIRFFSYYYRNIDKILEIAYKDQ